MKTPMKKTSKKRVSSKMVSDAFGRVDDDLAARRDSAENFDILIDLYSRASTTIKRRFFSEAARLGILFGDGAPGEMIVSSEDLTGRTASIFDMIPPSAIGPLFDTVDGRPTA